MNRRKYVFAIYGKNARAVKEKCGKSLLDNHLIMQEEELLVYENQVYDTGLPKKPVVLYDICLHFHGIIFPQKCSIDHLSDNREEVMRDIIKENSEDLKRVPYSIRNGSYVAITVDNEEKRFLAFTCFLNSIPFYYIEIDSCIVVSTDLELLAKAFKLEYTVNDGILEYYASGTNLSDKTAFPEVNCIPKGAYLESRSGKTHIDYYYKMPNEESPLSFDEHVDMFADLWEDTLVSIHSEKFKYGLGFTGGVDSRLILAALTDRKKPLLFTGAHPDNPDVVLAKHITERMGLKNYLIEDYSAYDRVKGYAKHNSMSDNPLLCHSFYTHEQMQFRKANNLTYTLTGTTEYQGGDHYYDDRRSILNPIRQSLPLAVKELTHSEELHTKLIISGLRYQSFHDDFEQVDASVTKSILHIYSGVYKKFLQQIGQQHTQESFLEKFRLIYKWANLLLWGNLSSRRYHENFSPSLNMELASFTAQVPLIHRDSRRMLLAYLKRYHPELSHFILSGTILSPNAPWLLHKAISPYVNVLNHLGIKIWPFQWYIKKYNDGSRKINQKRYALQRAVCEDSYFIKNTEFNQLYTKHKNNNLRLMRLYNIALFEKKMMMDEDQLYEYLCDVIERNRLKQNH